MSKHSEWDVGAERRILSFPAVQPCEGISLATLLDSLIGLSRRICSHRSKSFHVQRRNSREAIRQVGVLLVFFEEIRGSGSVLPESAVLSLSELHLNFQQIRFLLEDCSREDAKLWILMKSQFVATQYRVLIRAIATALDVLMPSTMDVCRDVEELVGLVAKQARKVKVDVDEDDERAANQVAHILKQFERGIEPEPGLISKVLDYLGIKTWSDCNKQIEFLTSEIDLEHPEFEEREVSLLSSLLGLMCYCRGALFQTGEYDDRISPVESSLDPETINFFTPEHFRCPVSLDLMTDPVTVTTGQTYDRSSITKWLEAGNPLCPVTGERLKNTELVPNTALKKLIHRFCRDNGICISKAWTRSRDMARTIGPGSGAFAGAIRSLSRLLARQVMFGSDEETQKAAYEMRLLVKSNVFIRTCLVDAGAVGPLLNLLRSSRTSGKENAMFALMKLSKHMSGKKAIVRAGGIVPIVGALEIDSSMELRQIAAATIFYLASVRSYRSLLGKTPRVIERLIELLKNGTTCGKKNALCAVFCLILCPDNKTQVIESGLVPFLANLLLDCLDKSELVKEIVAVLASVAETVEGTFQILQASALPAITRVLRSSTSESVREVCVSLLLSLCRNGGDEVVAGLAKEGPVMGALYSLVLQGTSSARKQANALIDLLQGFHDLRRN